MSIRVEMDLPKSRIKTIKDVSNEIDRIMNFYEGKMITDELTKAIKVAIDNVFVTAAYEGILPQRLYAYLKRKGIDKEEELNAVVKLENHMIELVISDQSKENDNETS
jgi:hypothetical protein